MKKWLVVIIIATSFLYPTCKVFSQEADLETTIGLDYLDLLDAMSGFWKDKEIHTIMEDIQTDFKHGEFNTRTTELLNDKLQYLSVKTERLNKRFQNNYRPYGNSINLGKKNFSFLLDEIDDLVEAYLETLKLNLALVNNSKEDPRIILSKYKANYKIVEEKFVAAGFSRVMLLAHKGKKEQVLPNRIKLISDRITELFGPEIEKYKDLDTEPAYLFGPKYFINLGDPVKLKKTLEEIQGYKNSEK